MAACWSTRHNLLHLNKENSEFEHRKMIFNPFQVKKQGDSPNSQEFTNWCTNRFKDKKCEHCSKWSHATRHVTCCLIYPKAQEQVWVDFSFKFSIKGWGKLVTCSRLTHRRRRREAGSITSTKCPYQSSQKKIKPRASVHGSVVSGRSLTYDWFPNMHLRQDVSVRDVQTF